MSNTPNKKTSNSHKANSNAINRGHEYEYLISALIGLVLCADKTVVDFKIISNSKKYGKFDDLILEIRRENDVEESFAFQFKHKEKPTTIIQSKWLESENNDFSLCKHFKEPLTETLKHCKLILFTNAHFDNDCESLQMFSVISSLNVTPFDFTRINAEAPHVFQFQSKTADRKHEEYLKRFSLYTSQKSSQEIEQEIIGIFKDNYGSEEETASYYINFFRHWHHNDYTSMVLTLNEIRFHLFDMIIGKHLKYFIDVEDKTCAKILQDFDVIIAKIWTENRKLIGDFSNVPSDFDLERKGKDLKIIPKKCTNPSEHATKIISHEIFNQRNFFLIDSDTLPEKIKHPQTLKHLVSNLKLKLCLVGFNPQEFDFQRVFTTLSDLQMKDYYEQVANKLKISLQGRDSFSLSDLTDIATLAQDITINDILEMSQQKYSIGKEYVVPKCYVKRCLSSPMIKISSVENISEDLFVIIGNSKFSASNLREIIRKPVVTVDEFLNESSQNCVIFVENYTQSVFEEIKKKVSNETINIHYLTIKDETHLQWKASDGNLTKLMSLEDFAKPFNVKEDDMFDVFTNRINVLCAHPGMGKSMLLHNIKKLCPPDFWPILIKLKEHTEFLSTFHTDDEIAEYFLQLEHENCPLINKIKRALLHKRKYLFLLDGLDEVSSDKVAKILKEVKKLSSKGFYFWISSRPILQRTIENSLNVFVIDLQKFNEIEQKMYIKSRLENSNSELSYLSFNEKLKMNFDKISKNSDILGIPLQLYMITEILLGYTDSPQSREDVDDLFILTNMFRCFIDGKYKHVFRKAGCDHFEHLSEIIEDSKAYRLQQYQIAGLKSCLENEDFLILNVRNDKRFLNEISEKGDFLGIISKLNSDQTIIFTHSTYGEYFAATWFACNRTNIQNLHEILFKEKYLNVRFMFDLILCENSPIHIAVLYQNIDKVKLYKNETTTEDNGGRIALHLACSYGSNYPNLDDNDNPIVNFEIIPENRLIDMKHKEILENLLHPKDDLEEIVLKVDTLFNWSCIDYTVNNFSLLVLEELLQYRKKIDFKLQEMLTQHKWTILYYSVIFGYKTLFKTAYQINTLNYNQNVILLYQAVRKNCWEIVNFLINTSNDLNINTVTVYNRSLLHVATLYGHFQIIRTLLDKGAAIEKADDYGKTALHIAVQENNIEAVKLLLDKNADCDKIDKFGNHVLHLAVSRKNTEIVKLILNQKKGVDVNVKDKNGMTPLHLAVKAQMSNVVKYLVKHGNADINAVDNKDRTPLYYALNCNNDNSICALLQERGN